MAMSLPTSNQKEQVKTYLLTLIDNLDNEKLSSLRIGFEPIFANIGSYTENFTQMIAVRHIIEYEVPVRIK